MNLAHIKLQTRRMLIATSYRYTKNPSPASLVRDGTHVDAPIQLHGKTT